jgi:FMN reductase
MSVLTIAGSPARLSRSSALLEYLTRSLEERGIATRPISLRDVPSEDLIEARYQSQAARIVRAKVDAARAIIIATPVYKASFGGGLKALLDLLPENAFAGKTVLPVVSGGSSGHLLVLEYGLKPVLSALGARHILAGIFASDAEINVDAEGVARIGDTISKRLDESVERLAEIFPASVVPVGARRLGVLVAESRCSAA